MIKGTVLRAAAFCAVVLIMMNVLNFIFWDDVHSLSRRTIQEMYDYNGNIDTVVIGSSFVVHGFNPAVADEVSGLHTYNAGTKMQTPDGSYYMLKEIIKHHELQTVYLDCNHVMLAQFERPNFGRNYLISVYMKPSLDRYRFVCETAGTGALIKNTFPFMIRKKLRFTSLVKAKLTDGYADGVYKYLDFDDEAYAGKGFVIKKGTMKAIDNYAPVCDINPDKPVTQFSLDNLDRIAALCRENNIRLVLVSFPVATEMLKRTPYIQEYVDAMQEYADTNGLEYHNYNLVKGKYCNLAISDFAEKEHLNKSGADSFTRQFMQTEAAILDGTLDADEVFCDSLEEKLTDVTGYLQK